MPFAGVKILLKYQNEAGKTIKEFKEFTASNAAIQSDLKKLGEAVMAFSEKFDIPGKDDV